MRISKKADEHARRHQQKTVIPDLRPAYYARLERLGRVQTTPEELRRQAGSEPFYLPELGSLRRLWNDEPRYEPGPVIRTGTRA